jgi:cob(I)alamin adenosyltransferase
MLAVFTGNGKGKTTAALGQMVRAVSGGRRSALMIQFIKSTGYPSGEDDIARLTRGKMRVIKGGIGFVGILGDAHTHKEHCDAAQKTWMFAQREIKKGGHALYVLDEINVALRLKLLHAKDVLPFLKKYATTRTIVVTGRGATKRMIALSDVATEMKQLRFKRTAARRGIEW